jgi:prepilin-type N-terminal cleavage/methylation domain-containing protein
MEYEKEQNMEYRIWNIEYWIRVIQHSTFDIQYSVSRGFTITELIIVFAILGFVMAITIPSLSKFRQNSALNADSMNLVTLANRARLLSVSDKGDKQFGIHLETSKVVLYQDQGSGYSAGASTNETYTLSSGITLTGTASEVLFAKVTGAASTAATSTLLVTGTTASTTILIYPTGIITIK